MIPVYQPSPGSLRTTPFADLLVHVLDRRATGTLVLDEPGVGRHGIYFEAGTPRQARTAAAVAPLGEVLVQSGAISIDAHQLALDQALEARKLYGQVLIALGAIDDQTLTQALREQLSRQVLWLFGLPDETRYGYVEGQNLFERWGAAPVGRINPVELLWRGLKDHAREGDIDAVVARLGDRQIVLREDMPLDYFFFMGPDRDVVEMLRDRPRTVAELLFAAPAFAVNVRRVLSLLVLTRSLDLGIRSFPPVGVEVGAVGPSVDLPPPPRAPELSEFFAQERSSRTTQRRARSEPVDILEAEIAAKARSESVFIGGSEPEPPRSEAVQIAPVEIAEEHEPWTGELELPTVPEPAGATPVPTHGADDPELQSSEPLLLDPGLEGEAGSDADRGPPSSGRHSGFEGGVEALRRIEVMLARGDLAAAEAKVNEVLAHERNNAECLGLRAWLASLTPMPDHARIASDLREALILAQTSVKVRWYRGLTYQRLGRHTSALKEFRFILELDPKHIDAAREVRLYERFQGAHPTEAGEAKSFGWLFGRRK